MNTNLIGSIGEQRLVLELLSSNFEVFTSVTGKTSVDIVGIYDYTVYRFQVKTVLDINRYGTYEVQLKSVRPNRTKNIIHKFNGLSCDILAVYCYKHDRIQYFKGIDLNGRSQININPLNFSEDSILTVIKDWC